MQKARELWEGLKTGWYLGTMFAGIDWPPWRRQSTTEQSR